MSTDPAVYRRLEALERAAALRQDRIATTITTYVPSYYGATTAGVTTYSANYPTGWYIVIGPMIHVWGDVVWTAATGTGEGRISLPVAQYDPGTPRDTPVMMRITSTAITNTVAQGLCRVGQDYWRLESVTGSGATTAEAVKAAGNISFYLAYPVSV
jgi:hypothetical protein